MHVYMLLICPHRDRINPWWLLQHISLVKKFLEDMISVFLSTFIIFPSEATITQIIFSHAKPLLTTLSQVFLGVGSNFFALL